jgi:hypothetical protein
MLNGCARPQHRETVEKICLPETDKPKAMQAAEDVLAQMHFIVTKADSEQGIIRTKSLPAAQSFEFWRTDNVGSFNSTEANLHSIRRNAELHISSRDGQLCINCYVKAQRLSLPERQTTSGASSYAMFTTSKRSVQVLQLHPEQKKDMAWIDLDNDTQLATEILKQIEKQLKRKE